jgi:nicotinate phosphoribosyltransferase
MHNEPAPALLNDLYQLTMAYGYWKARVADTQTVFHLYFRKNPFEGGFTLTAGLEDAIRFIENFRFDDSDAQYLSTLQGNDNRPLFDAGFLQYLCELKFTCDVDAMPEGTVAFPYEPIVRVQGPILQCQLVETALLNIINFQTLIATKAARVNIAAKGEPVLEFGARRAQGNDGALSASRAAYIGGCSATSNVWAGKTYGIPVKGTHAHSWVMLFSDELESFKAYAKALPNNCIFLVDTYNTLEGVKRAAQVGTWLRTLGYRFGGIRLDSGDLAYLSIEARKILNAAGFQNAQIVASNDLDETTIASLKEQGAAINVWGVGTNLVTGGDQAALGGVYKLAAVQDESGAWQPRVKISEQVVKTSNPGVQQVRRFEVDGEFVGDAIFDIHSEPQNGFTIVHPADPTQRKKFEASTHYTDVLTPVFREGQKVYDEPSIHAIREDAQKQLAGFNNGIKRFVNPHSYPAGLEKSLHKEKVRLIAEAKGLEE